MCPSWVEIGDGEPLVRKGEDRARNHRRSGNGEWGSTEGARSAARPDQDRVGLHVEQVGQAVAVHIRNLYALGGPRHEVEMTVAAIQVHTAGKPRFGILPGENSINFPLGNPLVLLPLPLGCAAGAALGGISGGMSSCLPPEAGCDFGDCGSSLPGSSWVDPPSCQAPFRCNTAPNVRGPLAPQISLPFGTPAFQRSYVGYLGCWGTGWASFVAGGYIPSEGNPQTNLGKATWTAAAAFVATGLWPFAAVSAGSTVSAAADIRTQCTRSWWDPNYGN